MTIPAGTIVCPGDAETETIVLSFAACLLRYVESSPNRSDALFTISEGIEEIAYGSPTRDTLECLGGRLWDYLSECIADDTYFGQGGHDGAFGIWTRKPTDGS